VSTLDDLNSTLGPEDDEALLDVADEKPLKAASAASGDDDEPAEPDCPTCKSGAPAWMATFADMATLLMAFFVLLLSFSDTELPKFEQLNGSIQAAFGVRKIVPTIQIPAARSLVVETFTPALAQRTVVDQQTQLGENMNAENLVVRDNDASEDFEIEEEFRRVEAALAEAIESGEIKVLIDEGAIVVQIAANNTESPGGSSDDSARSGQVSQRLVELSAAVAEAQLQVSRELQVISVDPAQDANEPVASAASQNDAAGEVTERLEQVRSELSSEIQQGLVEVEMVNNMIVIRLASQNSFLSGSADLQPDFMPLLSQVGASIADISGVIRVEGHTDNVPVVFSDRFTSNWDLSAVRAASVAAYLNLTTSISAQRLSVKGLADTVPLEPNTSAEGRARNRRIEIIVDGN
jgi:chemotaxis protein MotB